MQLKRFGRQAGASAFEHERRSSSVAGDRRSIGRARRELLELGQRRLLALPVETALEWGAASSTLAAVALCNETAKTLTTANGPIWLARVNATPNLFASLGVAPLAGRAFESADRDVRQVVLSHGAWRRYFEGAPSTVGSLVMLDGAPHRVVGVMPQGFDFPSPETTLWIAARVGAPPRTARPC